MSGFVLFCFLVKGSLCLHIKADEDSRLYFDMYCPYLYLNENVFYIIIQHIIHFCRVEFSGIFIHNSKFSVGLLTYLGIAGKAAYMLLQYFKVYRG